MKDQTEFFDELSGETYKAVHVPRIHREWPLCHGCVGDQPAGEISDLCQRLPPCDKKSREDGIAIIWTKLPE